MPVGFGSGAPSALSIGGPLSAFGELLSSELTPYEQVAAQYGLTDRMETFTATGGSATVSNNEFVCQTGTSVGGYGVIRTKKAISYHGGQGVEGRFTARFTTGVANCFQLAGLFTVLDALGFGYNGTQFGILYRKGGELEVRTLTITGAAGGGENATITINDAEFTVALTAGTTAHNAHEIAVSLDAQSSAWDFRANGSVVTMIATSVGAKSGTYSFTSGTATASFAQVAAGTDNAEYWTAQSSWNVNTCSWLDPTKGNVYSVPYQYLGYGAFRFYIENPSTGLFELVHMIKNANSVTAPTLSNPSMKVGWASASLGSTTNLTVAGGSCALFYQGKRVLSEPARAVDNSKTGISTTATNILTIRNRLAYNGKRNLAAAMPLQLTCSTDSTKGARVRVYKSTPDNPVVLSGEPNFSYVSQTNSIIEYDTSATTYTSGGRLIESTYIGATSSAEDNLEQHQEELLPGESLVMVANVTAGAASQIDVGIKWREDI